MMINPEDQSIVIMRVATLLIVNQAFITCHRGEYQAPHRVTPIHKIGCIEFPAIVGHVQRFLTESVGQSSLD